MTVRRLEKMVRELDLQLRFLLLRSANLISHQVHVSYLEPRWVDFQVQRLLQAWLVAEPRPISSLNSHSVRYPCFSSGPLLQGSLTLAQSRAAGVGSQGSKPILLGSLPLTVLASVGDVTQFWLMWRDGKTRQGLLRKVSSLFKNTWVRVVPSLSWDIWGQDTWNRCGHPMTRREANLRTKPLC